MEVTMNEAKQTLKTLEQSIKLLQQQQKTFINALERTRESAHDRIRPVMTLAQVRNYLDSHCNNRTDKRISLSFWMSVRIWPSSVSSWNLCRMTHQQRGS
ncbi:unnamed protein product [Staurois parvus]|uniref:Uncharacterized protein n=1 Tax=Staurois parvus TaxID=386267 RepID=A0ABN9AE45_9NEOB|nr:unnamed protein product [Staurois parvus]